MNPNKEIFLNTELEAKLENLIQGYYKKCIKADAEMFLEYNSTLRTEKLNSEKAGYLKELKSNLETFKSQTESEISELEKEIDKTKFPLRDSLNSFKYNLISEYQNALLIFNSTDLDLIKVLNSLKTEKRNDVFFYLCGLIFDSNKAKLIQSDVKSLYNSFAGELGLTENENSLEALNILLKKILIYLQEANFNGDFKNAENQISKFMMSLYN